MKFSDLSFSQKVGKINSVSVILYKTNIDIFIRVEFGGLFLKYNFTIF